MTVLTAAVLILRRLGTRMRLRMADIVADHPEMTEYEPLFADTAAGGVAGVSRESARPPEPRPRSRSRPAVTELDSTPALLDENPFNDRFGRGV